MARLGSVFKHEIKRIGSDNLFIVLALYPILLILLGRYFVPFITNSLLPGFDLTDHYPTIMAFLILINPYMYGAMAAFMVLDDREDRSIQAVQVTPLTLSSYLNIRTTLIVLISIISGVLITLLVDLFPITLGQSIIINTLLALAAPFNMVLINNIAKNKVEGFAVVKGTGIMLMLPLVAFYIPQKYSLLAGIVPGYWPAMAIGRLADPSFGIMPYWAYSLIGFAYILVLIRLMYKRFNKKIVS